MITTNSFLNAVTSIPNNEIEKNSLTKEDLEGKKKKRGLKLKDSQEINKNGGTYQIIKL